MLDFHTLRLAGRSRRVYDVSQVVGQGDRLDGICSGSARLDATNTELVGQFGVFGSGHENTGTAIFNDRADAQRGILRVDRHVCGARAQDSMDRNHKLR